MEEGIEENRSISSDVLDASGAALDALLKEVGQKVTVLRHRRELTQDQLALRAGCGTNTVIAVENGKRNVTVRSLAIISAALSVQLRDLFPNSEQFERPVSVLTKLAEEIDALKMVIERMQALISNADSGLPRTGTFQP